MKTRNILHLQTYLQVCRQRFGPLGGADAQRLGGDDNTDVSDDSDARHSMLANTNVYIHSVTQYSPLV